MFCEHCGQQLNNDARFCTNCGANITPAVTPPVQPVQPVPPVQPVQPVQTTPANKNKRPLLIVLAVFIGIAIIGLSINLLDMFVINSSKKLENKLINIVWCSEPLETVAVDGSGRMLTAYTIEFHAGGTATKTTYIASDDYYDTVTKDELEVYDKEIVMWHISRNRTLVVDGQEFKHKMLLDFSDENSSWYVKDNMLHLNKTYYNEAQYDFLP